MKTKPIAVISKVIHSSYDLEGITVDVTNKEFKQNNKKKKSREIELPKIVQVHKCHFYFSEKKEG